MKLNLVVLISTLITLGLFASLDVNAQTAEPKEQTPTQNLEEFTEPQEQAPTQEFEEFIEPQGMTQTKIKRIVSEIAEEVSGEANNLRFYYNGANLALISNLPANRMRIISPIMDAKSMNEQQILSSLLANYHLALDARYAIGNGVLYSVYIHPLKELTEDQLVSAVRQVATLRNTFGTTYTSGELSFGVEVEEEKVEL